MKKLLKNIYYQTAYLFLKKELVDYIGVKNIVIYFFFQRILRINSHVKWQVHWSSIVSSPEKIKLKYWRPFPGYMPGAYIQAQNGIEIGKNVRIGPGVKIISASHDIYDYDLHTKDDPIIISNNCWLAANSVILPGVEIGEHTIVAAGAVVNKSFKNGNCILGGVPAKIIKTLEPYRGDVKW